MFRKSFLIVYLIFPKYVYIGLPVDIYIYVHGRINYIVALALLYIIIEKI